MINLIKDVLANGLDKNYRENLIFNFKKIEQAVNEIISFQATLNSDQNNINQILKNIKDDNKTRDANMQEIVRILSDYDVPIQIVDGKVIRTEEGE